MVVPNAEFEERMAQTVTTLGGSLPLDPNTGEMACEALPKYESMFAGLLETTRIVARCNG